MAAPGSADEPERGADGETAARPDDGPDESLVPGEHLAAVQRELAEVRDRLARARADYDNLQRRVTREASMERERNKARVLESFLPLLELAHMAAHQANAHPSPVSEGVILLAREFDRLVEREGLQRIGTVGEAVDPARHEVLAQEAPAATNGGHGGQAGQEGHEGAGGPEARVKSGHVSRVIQPGYMLGDKVLRYAKVCVAP